MGVLDLRRRPPPRSSSRRCAAPPTARTRRAATTAARASAARRGSGSCAAPRTPPRRAASARRRRAPRRSARSAGSTDDDERPGRVRRQPGHARFDGQHVAPLVRRHPRAPRRAEPAPPHQRHARARGKALQLPRFVDERRRRHARHALERRTRAMHHSPSAASARSAAGGAATTAARRCVSHGGVSSAAHASAPTRGACRGAAPSTRHPRRLASHTVDRHRHQPLADSPRLLVLADDEVDARSLERRHVADRAREAAPLERDAEHELQRLLVEPELVRQLLVASAAPARPPCAAVSIATSLPPANAARSSRDQLRPRARDADGVSASRATSIVTPARSASASAGDESLRRIDAARAGARLRRSPD